jgi:beta-lactamase superfamily II metal-dependent hydrolase
VTDTTTLTAAGAEFTLYPPLREHYEKDEDNNASLLSAVDYQGSSLLFTGDALKPRVTEFLEQQYDGTDYQFLKVPHHGREAKPTALLLEAFSCSDALITSSAQEPESEKLLQKLEKNAVKAWLTREGLVTLTCQNGTIEIRQ